MNTVSLRELRNRSREVMERVLLGESLTVTRAGAPVAELRPVRRPGLDSETLLHRWRRVPPVDPVAFCRDLERAVDPRNCHD